MTAGSGYVTARWQSWVRWIPKQVVDGWKCPDAGTYHVWPERCISLNPSCVWRKRFFFSMYFHRVKVPSELSGLVFSCLSPFFFQLRCIWKKHGLFSKSIIAWIVDLGWKRLPRCHAQVFIKCLSVSLCVLTSSRHDQAILWKGHFFSKRRQLHSCLQSISQF